jgi:DnaK suppressor protein
MNQTNGAAQRSVRRQVIPPIPAAEATAKEPIPAKWRSDDGTSAPPNVAPQPAPRDILRRLRQERQHLLDEIAHCGMPLQEHPTTVTHIADDASEVADQITTLALRHHLEELLEDTDRVIVRAEKGMYGICEQCQRPIAAERLQALLTATTCITCARARIHRPKGPSR